MHGLARPIGNRLTPHSSGEVRPQISELARVHRSHGPDREQREQADQEPGQRKSRPVRSAIVDVAIGPPRLPHLQWRVALMLWFSSRSPSASAASTNGMPTNRKPPPRKSAAKKLSSFSPSDHVPRAMNQRKAMPARPQHRRVRPVAEQAPPPHQSASTDANFVPGAETTQAPLDAVVDRDPAPVRQIVSQIIGSSEVTRSTGRDVVVGPAATIPWGHLAR